MSTPGMPDEIGALADYITDGFMSEEDARKVAGQAITERAVLAGWLSELSDPDMDEGEAQRLDWLVNRLGRDPLNATVFVITVVSKPEIAYKYGLSSRPFDGGRHSSPLRSDRDAKR